MARLNLAFDEALVRRERLADGTAIRYTAFSPDHPHLSKVKKAMTIVDRTAEAALREHTAGGHFDGLPGGTAFANLWRREETRVHRTPDKAGDSLVTVHANRTDIAIHEGAMASRSHWEIAAALCQELAQSSGPLRPKRGPRLRDWRPAALPPLEATTEAMRRCLADAALA